MAKIGKTLGKIRAMISHEGKNLEVALPSMPVEILGMQESAKAGDEFFVVENEEEAIKITNDTEYGLGNYLQTEDKEKAKRVSKKLRAGIIYVNNKPADSGTPFGGYRQSGNGREGGTWGLHEYLEVKTITEWVN